MNIEAIRFTNPTHARIKAKIRGRNATRQWLKIRDRRNWRKRPLKSCRGEA